MKVEVSDFLERLEAGAEDAVQVVALLNGCGEAICDHKSDYLGDVARAVFDRIGKTTPVQVVGGLTTAQARSLAQHGLRAFVISGNLGQADGVARYDVPAAEMQRLIASFMSEVSGQR